MNNGPLTPTQGAFCRAYIETGNASEAQRRAYDTKNMAPATVHRKAPLLLSEGTITARLKELQEGHKKRHEVTVDRIIAELSNIAFTNTGDFFDWGPNGVVVKDESKLTPEQLAVVSEVSQTITEGTIRVKLHSKLEALDKLAWHLGPGAVLGAPPGRLPREGNPSDQFWEMRARDAGPPTCYNVRRT